MVGSVITFVFRKEIVLGAGGEYQGQVGDMSRYCTMYKVADVSFRNFNKLPSTSSEIVIILFK